ncbi:hypothetical protein EB796_008198 [Bugula neritina]|uniref:Uncharacterized protein n=1 Tax=Bugula neritina TaxID=10212 RepID=A0A7J7K5K8_BUGNE|nr:hypothetical protein EB796_008198 [Bugula neritina]
MRGSTMNVTGFWFLEGLLLLSIPYADRKRVDTEYMTIATTVSGLFRFYKSLSHVKPFIESCNENSEWWNACIQRLMEAYGTNDLEAPITHKMEVFLLLGRKPNNS